MTKRSVKDPDEWLSRVLAQLKEMAESWSGLSEPAEDLYELLMDKVEGSSFTMTAELKAKLNAIHGVVVKCPHTGDGPTLPCLAPPSRPKPARRSAARKRRPT